MLWETRVINWEDAERKVVTCLTEDTEGRYHGKHGRAYQPTTNSGFPDCSLRRMSILLHLRDCIEECAETGESLVVTSNKRI
jgi:hypothetical protein